MSQLMQSRAARSLCYVIITALVAAIAPMTLATPAGAQLMPTYSVGVVDFVNESGVQGELLARLATDAVVVEMAKTNRYDVSITRTHMREQMEELGLRPPLTKLGLVMLGEALSTDAMLEGVIKSVSLAGSGPTRRASVTLVVQMIDQASGEIINGAVQTGTSSARIAYIPGDDSLITEAINNAAFLVRTTMVDYIIPEATVMIHVGEGQVMLNKGSRDGLKPGMRMIVLRQREIIGYVEVRTVDPTDCIAKVTKSMRGVQPEDKVRAIYEMPAVSTSLKSEPLPSSAPTGGGGSKSALSKIGKFLLYAAILFGLVSLVRTGTGAEPSPSTGALEPMQITWNPTEYNHYQGEATQLQILRDGMVYKVLSGVDASQFRSTSLLITSQGQPYYGPGGALYTVNYNHLDGIPSSSYTQVSATVNQEPFGAQHTYQMRVFYGQATVSGETVVNEYFYTGLGSSILATAIELVRKSDIVWPQDGTEVLMSRLASGLDRFEWQQKEGANQYYIKVEPVTSGTAPTWQSPPFYEPGGSLMLRMDDQRALANLLNNPVYEGVNMKWRVYCRSTADTSAGWVVGEQNVFTVGVTPPMP